MQLLRYCHTNSLWGGATLHEDFIPAVSKWRCHLHCFTETRKWTNVLFEGHLFNPSNICCWSLRTAGRIIISLTRINTIIIVVKTWHAAGMFCMLHPWQHPVLPLSQQRLDMLVCLTASFCPFCCVVAAMRQWWLMFTLYFERQSTCLLLWISWCCLCWVLETVHSSTLWTWIQKKHPTWLLVPTIFLGFSDSYPSSHIPLLLPWLWWQIYKGLSFSPDFYWMLPKTYLTQVFFIIKS